MDASRSFKLTYSYVTITTFFVITPSALHQHAQPRIPSFALTKGWRSNSLLRWLFTAEILTLFNLVDIKFKSFTDAAPHAVSFEAKLSFKKYPVLFYMQILWKGNTCLQIEFLCIFSSLCTFYFFGGLGLEVALIRIIADTFSILLLAKWPALHVSVTSFHLDGG